MGKVGGWKEMPFLFLFIGVHVVFFSTFFLEEEKNDLACTQS